MTTDNRFEFSNPNFLNKENTLKNPIIGSANKIHQEITQNKQELEKYRQESLVDSLTGC